MSDNVNSIFANFGLNAVDGGDAMAQGNPILAFLQALQSQVDREEGSSSKEWEQYMYCESNTLTTILVTYIHDDTCKQNTLK